MPCYDQSCTASDLVSIPSLVLSDTFNTWFDRTNQLIQVSNSLNLLDIGVGPTNGGLLIERGCTNGYYSGVAVLYVRAGAGLGIGTEAFTNNYNKVVVDAASLQDYGGNTASNPAPTDYYIISDKSDTRQGADGTPKRIVASRILPNTIEFGTTGNGTLNIQGNLNVIGNISVAGTQSYIDSNDLRIEDKMIELAYGRYAEMVVEGSSLTAGTFSAGMTAFYDDTLVPNTEENASTVGKVYSWALGTTSASGTTGTIRISSFSVGGVDDFVAGGNLVITGSGYASMLEVTGSIGIGDYFLTDDQLQPAGIVIKGSEGDKTFLWVCNAADNGGENWNAFVANKNLGVSGPSNWILSSKFASYGYLDSSVNNTFTYLGQGDTFTKYTVGNQLVMEHSITGATSQGATFGIVNMGSTGPNVFPGVPVYDWVKYFNADQLDGAHATTASIPWHIPIMGAEGRVAGDLLSADSIRKTFTVSGHAFSKGDIVRVNTNGSLTFAAANTVPTAEALGMVDSVSGNSVTLVTKGFISGLTGTRINAVLPLATGNVYFLSPTTLGGLIDSPDTGVGIGPGEVRKAMLLAMGSNSGYVLNYTGVVEGDEPTDTIYMSTFAPIGSIQSYAGPATRLPRSWLLCDGRRVDRNLYPELYDLIGQTFYAQSTKGGADSITMVGDTRQLAANDNVRLEWSVTGGTVATNAVVLTVTENTRVVTLSIVDTDAFTAIDTGTTVRVYGRVASSNTSTFFIPDLRGRSPFGASVGVSIPGSGNILPSLLLGDMGGSHETVLNQQAAEGTVVWGNSTSTVSNMPPYTAMNWIIRAKKGADATILTGHNHDFNYVRYDIPHTISGGAANNLSSSNRSQFRTNTRTLGNGLDGSETYYNNLVVDGDLTIADDLRVEKDSLFGSYGHTTQFEVIGSQGSYVNLSPPLMWGITGSVSRSTQQTESPTTVNVSDHRYDEFYPTGGTTATNNWGLNARTAKAVPLTIQSDDGMITATPMYRVINRDPTEFEKSRLPQGFIWVNTTKRKSYIKSGNEVHELGSVASGVPVGTIVMWGGTIASIPGGWALCDGGTYNGVPTPDLRNKFIIGAAVAAPTFGFASTTIEGEPTQTGGEAKVTLTIDQIPLHSHEYLDVALAEAHGLWRPTGAGTFGLQGGEGIDNDNGFLIRGRDNRTYRNGPTTPGYENPLTSPTGSSSPHENLPPYYALAYIMKVVADNVEDGPTFEPNPPPCDACAEIDILRGQIKTPKWIRFDKLGNIISRSGTDISVGRIAPGRYNIVHNLQTTAYSVQITPHFEGDWSASPFQYVASIATNSCEVQGRYYVYTSNSQPLTDTAMSVQILY